MSFLQKKMSDILREIRSNLESFDVREGNDLTPCIKYVELGVEEFGDEKYRAWIPNSGETIEGICFSNLSSKIKKIQITCEPFGFTILSDKLLNLTNIKDMDVLLFGDYGIPVGYIFAQFYIVIESSEPINSITVLYILLSDNTRNKIADRFAENTTIVVQPGKPFVVKDGFIVT